MQDARFGDCEALLAHAARVALAGCLRLERGERAVIVTNPCPEVAAIARALYDAALELQARPTLIFQPPKSQLDFAEEAVYAALTSRPEAVISVSEEKLGKDRAGIASPFSSRERSYDSLFHYLLYGEKCLRSFWSPRVTREIFMETVPIDYARLAEQCRAVKETLDGAREVHVESPAGTNLTVGLRGRRAMTDDGDFSRPGAGGNLPAGETFISPENGCSEGVVVFDGSVALHEGAVVPRSPIRVEVAGGLVADIRGGPEAGALLEAIEKAERQAREMGRQGELASERAELYARNARNLGELGIGLNPKARVTGNMLNDEKVCGTCHIAVGHNYDEDAPALIHLDGLIREPTITAILAGGDTRPLMRAGKLVER